MITPKFTLIAFFTFMSVQSCFASDVLDSFDMVQSQKNARDNNFPQPLEKSFSAIGNGQNKQSPEINTYLDDKIKALNKKILRIEENHLNSSNKFSKDPYYRDYQLMIKDINNLRINNSYKTLESVKNDVLELYSKYFPQDCD